ncbi:MAG: hypothetical protein ACRDZO_04540 [Egibacteraceae bacterium]
MSRMPIHLAETLAVGSIENFLSTGDMAQLTQIMDSFLAQGDLARFGEKRAASIHEIPGHTPAQAMAVYEPAGRLEVPAIPDEAEQLLQRSFDLARPALARLLPSVTACRPWTYVEYGPRQHITSHLDGIAPDPLSWPRQIAGVSIIVGAPAHGGAFYVETTSHEGLWDQVCDDSGSGYLSGMRFAHDGADHSADWFRGMPSTRWSVDPAPGTALLYGSQVAHGTEPVIEGKARKFISWLIAETK